MHRFPLRSFFSPSRYVPLHASLLVLPLLLSDGNAVQVQDPQHWGHRGGAQEGSPGGPSGKRCSSAVCECLAVASSMKGSRGELVGSLTGWTPALTWQKTHVKNCRSIFPNFLSRRFQISYQKWDAGMLDLGLFKARGDPPPQGGVQPAPFFSSPQLPRWNKVGPTVLDAKDREFWK